MKRLNVADAAALAVAAEALEAGGLVLVPTETVYGIAARLDRPAAVARVFAAKGRPVDRPLQVLVPSAEAAVALARAWPRPADRLAARFWPGPLTLVVPGPTDLPEGVAGPGDTIGLRCPDHEGLQALLELTGPLAASSANRTGDPPATTAAAAIAALGDEVELALDGGPAAGGVASTVVRVTGEDWTVLRLGALSQAEIADHAGSA